MRAPDIAALEADYIAAGWCRFALPDRAQIEALRTGLTERLRAASGKPGVALETYHDHVDEAAHEEVQWRLVNALWDDDIGVALGRGQFAVLRQLIGPDLLVQARPFLRIARPGVRADNIGFHRDTSYGQSPYEVTFYVPLTDLDADGALQVVSGSHTLPADAVAETEAEKPGWERGSPKHAMGFPYAPKALAPAALAGAEPIPLTVGEAILFSPSLIHGQEVNRSATTRFSIDVRFVAARAPIAISRDTAGRGYKPVHASAVETVAASYLAAQRA